MLICFERVRAEPTYTWAVGVSFVGIYGLITGTAPQGIPSSDTTRQLRFNQRDTRHIELSNCHDIQSFLGTNHEKNDSSAIKHVDLTIAIVAVPTVLAKLAYATLSNIMWFFEHHLTSKKNILLMNNGYVLCIFKKSRKPQQWYFKSGWWYTYPFEKTVSWDDFPFPIYGNHRIPWFQSTSQKWIDKPMDLGITHYPGSPGLPPWLLFQ